MNCENYKDKIIAYIDNELNESDRISFEKELKSNSKLNAEYTEMKDLLNSLKTLMVACKKEMKFQKFYLKCFQMHKK